MSQCHHLVCNGMKEVKCQRVYKIIRRFQTNDLFLFYHLQLIFFHFRQFHQNNIQNHRMIKNLSRCVILPKEKEVLLKNQMMLHQKKLSLLDLFRLKKYLLKLLCEFYLILNFLHQLHLLIHIAQRMKCYRSKQLKLLKEIFSYHHQFLFCFFGLSLQEDENNF